MFTKKVSAKDYVMPSLKGYKLQARPLEVSFMVFTHQYDFKPEQARALAQALLDAAEESERLADTDSGTTDSD